MGFVTESIFGGGPLTDTFFGGAEKKAAETGETDVEKCMEPEAILLREVLERAERPQLPDNLDP